MRTILLRSAPALAVLFALTVGFLMLNDLGASDSENMNYCSQLWEICAQEADYASNTCLREGTTSTLCQEANKDAKRSCDAAAEYCDASGN